MHTTEPSTSPASVSPTVDELLEDIVPVVDAVYVAGPPVLVTGAATVLLALMLAGPFALLVTLVVVFVATVALVALAVAIVAAPFLLVRRLHGRGVVPAVGRSARRRAARLSHRLAT